MVVHSASAAAPATRSGPLRCVVTARALPRQCIRAGGDAPAGGTRRACVPHAASAAQSAQEVPGSINGSAVYAKADSLLKERFGRPKHEADQDAIRQRMSEYQSTCFAFLAQEASKPDALAVLAASLKRVPVEDMPRLVKKLEDACIAQSHTFSLEAGYEVVNNLQSFNSPRRGAHGAIFAARLCSRWTTARGLRELSDPNRLKLVLELCIMAARNEQATPEHASALISHMQTHPELSSMELVAIVLDLTVRLRPSAGRADALALLAAVLRHEGGDDAGAMQCSGTDAALVLHRMLRLGLRDDPPASAASQGQGGKDRTAAAAAEPPLAQQLTWRVAAEPGEVHTALLVRAMDASSQLLGFVFVPLMKVVVGRLSNPAGARVLSMDAVCTALQVLRSAKQLASYNKASGSILKSMAHDDAASGDAQQPAGAEASEEDRRAARKVAHSTALAIPRDRLCGAVCNVLAVLALHLQRTLPEEHLSALPPPPRSLQQRVRYLPPHMQASASAVSTAQWIETLFETVVLDNWVVGHVAVGPELEWSQAATLRVVWRALVEEARAPPSPAAPRTSGVMLQRLLYSHAQHRQAVPEAASGMVAALLVAQVHSLTAEQLSHTIWALGRLRLRHAGLVAALTQGTRRHLEALHAEQIAHILSSLATLGVNDTWLVRALGNAMLNRLHQGSPLRVALAVQTLKALSEYREGHPQLLSALHHRVMHNSGGAGAKPRRIAPHLLADLALAIGDLHTHCSGALAPVPHVLALTTQAVTEAVSGGRTQFVAEDLDKVRHFCVATGARELLPDVMLLLKTLSSSSLPDSSDRSSSQGATVAATSPARPRPHRSVEEYLSSSRGQQIRREHETMPMHGRPLGFQDDAAFAAGPPAAVSGHADVAALPDKPALKPVKVPVGRVPTAGPPQLPKAARAAGAAVPAAGQVDTRPKRTQPAEKQRSPVPEIRGAPERPAAPRPVAARVPKVAGAAANGTAAAHESHAPRPRRDAGNGRKLNTRDLKPRTMSDPDAVQATEEFHELMHSHMRGNKYAEAQYRAVAAEEAATADPTEHAQHAQQPAADSDSDIDEARVAEEAMQELKRPAAQRAQHAAAPSDALRAARRAAPLKSRPAHHAVPAAEDISQAAIDAAAAEFSLRGAATEKSDAAHAGLAEHAGSVEEALEAALLAPVAGGASWLDEIKRVQERRDKPKGKKKSKHTQGGRGAAAGDPAQVAAEEPVDPAAQSEAQAKAVAEATAAAVEAAEKAVEGKGPQSNKARRRHAERPRDRASAVAAMMKAVSAASPEDATGRGSSTAEARAVGPAGNVARDTAGGGAALVPDGGSGVNGNGGAAKAQQALRSHPVMDVEGRGSPAIGRTEVAAAEAAAAEKAAAEAAAEKRAAAEAASADRVALDATAAEQAAAAAAAEVKAAVEAASDKAAADASAEEKATAQAAAMEQAAMQAAAAKKGAMRAAAAEQATLQIAAVRKAAAKAAAEKKAALEAAAAENAAADEAAAAEKAAADEAAAEQAAAEALAAKRAADEAAAQQAAEAAAAKRAADAAAAEKVAEAAAGKEAADAAAAAEKAAAEQEAAAVKAAAEREAARLEGEQTAQAVNCEVVTEEQFSEAQRRWAATDAADSNDPFMSSEPGPHSGPGAPDKVGDSDQGVWVDVAQLMWDLAEQDPEVHAVLQEMAGEDGEIPPEALDFIAKGLMAEDGAAAVGAARARQSGGEDGSGPGRGFGGGSRKRRGGSRKHARRSAQRLAEDLCDGAAEDRGGSHGGPGGWQHPMPPGMN